MNQRGGKRPGAGRKPGATNKRTKEAVAKAQAEGKLPLDVMMEAMRAAYEKGGPCRHREPPFAWSAAEKCRSRSLYRMAGYYR